MNLSLRTALLSTAFALAACDLTVQDLGLEGRPRPIADESAGGAAGNCVGCHGDPAREGDALVRAAPPSALLGRDPGAHLAHVKDGTFRAPLACAECHYVPTLRDHADGVTAVSMTGLAATAPAAPAWDAGTGTCSGVYCHGATLGGGPAAAPPWTSTAGLGCTSCHGAPPPPPHATSASCGACHGGYTASSVNPATHLNGAVDASGGHAAGFADPTQHGYAASRDLAACRTCHGPALTGGTSGVSCDSCHGGPAWRTDCTFCHGTAPGGPASPPVDTQGRTARTYVSVGAHAAHVGTAITAPLGCADCHPSRTGSDVVTDAAHVDGDGRAEVVLGARAGAGATYARASDTSATCSSTACHGAAAIAWTSSAPLGCTGCHGAPPAAPHTTNPNCGACHSGYTSSSANPATHLDGTVQAAGGHAAGYASPAVHGAEVNRVGLGPCKTCHGVDLAGGVSGISCDGCHGGTAAWRTTCTFCHGTSPSGPASPPVDTQGRSATSNVSVGAHAAHVATAIATPLACTVCHPDRAGSDVLADAAHVDGDARAEVVFGTRAGASATYSRASDTSATCASTWCHGAAALEWTSTANLGCTSCHGVPPPAPHTTSTSCGACHTGYTSSSVVAATHVDGTVQTTSPHAAGFASPTAHGYDVNRTGLASCKACHGADLAFCATCHGGTTWQTSCTFCHGASPSGPASPPVDTQGRSATSNVSVGAHAAHVATALTTPLACIDCHPDRTGSNVGTDAAHVDGDGRAEVVLGARAGAGATYTRASGTSATCASTSCHGAPAIEWTSTAPLGCASCHGAPPAAPHTTSTDCGACHIGYTSSAVSAATHLNGAPDFTSPHAAGYVNPAAHGREANAAGFGACAACHGLDLASCNACHGGTAWQTRCTFCHGTSPSGPASPPVDTQGRSATTTVSVGAHAAHVGSALTAGGVACAECHPDRTGSNATSDAAHVDGDGRAEIAFGPLAGAASIYARASDTSATCASTYCHGAATVEWTSTANLGCASCHGAPPAAPHTTSTSCGACHTGYTSSTVNAATHLNGAPDWTSPHAAGYAASSAHGYEVNRSGLASCKGCHGTNLASCNTCHGGTAWQTSCTFCHGTKPSGPTSPPVDTQGRTATTTVSVGAHAAHVGTALRTGGVACAVCHPDRTGSNATSDAAHVDGDGRAEIAFGPLAGASAQYARASDTSATCASTYCHGAATVQWTSTANLGCASCHGAPPPAPHTTSASCGACHTGYTSSTVNAATHLNGAPDWTSPHAIGYASPTAHGYEVNASGLATCAGCHGTNLASCNGCHGGTAWQTTCTFCHGTPAGAASPPVDTQGRSATTTVSVGAHAAHVGTALRTGGVACTECHPDRAGSNATTDPAHVDGDAVAEIAFGTLAGTSSTYLRVSGTSATCSSTYCHGASTVEWTDATPLGCGACHGAPPLAPHIQSTDCGLCHDGYTSSGVNAATHLDGAVQWSSPHAAGYAAPAAHGHDVNRSGLASCKGCHGPDLASCNTCHTTAGFPSWATTCTFCHGDPSNGRASPPVDTQGGSATTNVSVGLHASHVGATIAAPIACTQCHADRSASDVVTDAAHVDGDGVAEVSFGALATTGGAPATYTRVSATSATCASTYCHGKFAGGASASVGWTATAPVTCTSCHGFPPATGSGFPPVHVMHASSPYLVKCANCHATVVDGAGGIVNPSLHVNGAKEVKIGGSYTNGSGTTYEIQSTATWYPATRSCSGLYTTPAGGCHGGRSW